MPDNSQSLRNDIPQAQASARLFERARRVMPSGYTRNMIVAKPHPVYVAEADGCWVTDVDGNRRIDWANNFASLIHGHNKREVVGAIQEQAGRLLSVTMPTEWEVELAELLVDRIEGVEQIRFTNSGTEALMVAVKAARALTGRAKVAKIEGSWHGQCDLLEASYMPTPQNWGDRSQPATVRRLVARQSGPHRSCPYRRLSRSA